MPAHLSVGVETNCTAPLQLERASMRLCQLFGVDSSRRRRSSRRGDR